MRYTSFIVTILLSVMSVSSWAASELAPAVPDLSLPLEVEEQPAAPVAQPQTPKTEAPVVRSRKPVTPKKPKPAPVVQNKVIDINTADIANDEVMVQKMNPTLPPVSVQNIQPEKQPAADKPVVPAAAPVNPPTGRRTVTEAGAAAAGVEAGVVAARDTNVPAIAKNKIARVTYQPVSDRDPTLSPDDVLLLKHREEERLRAIELEKQRKIEAEKKRLADLERQRQLELERLRDPSREIRGKIHINGIIGQEVFIGDKVYTVGKTVLGAKIVSIQPDAVVFLYKGQRFTKKVTLK